MADRGDEELHRFIRRRLFFATRLMTFFSGTASAAGLAALTVATRLAGCALSALTAATSVLVGAILTTLPIAFEAFFTAGFLASTAFLAAAFFAAGLRSLTGLTSGASWVEVRCFDFGLAADCLTSSASVVPLRLAAPSLTGLSPQISSRR